MWWGTRVKFAIRRSAHEAKIEILDNATTNQLAK
jgi:hypothetical protein